jgi:hypothetical protein
MTSGYSLKMIYVFWSNSENPLINTDEKMQIVTDKKYEHR